MTDLWLYYHPLSSCCHKVLIAVDELGVQLDLRLLNLGDGEERAAHRLRWPLGKMPLLVDRGRSLPETSIIIEHLQLHHVRAGSRLIPDERDAALEVRLWDRLIDLYVMTPMQSLTADLLRPAAERRPQEVAEAQETLLSAYALIERQLQGHSWMAGEAFSMADCAAAPALFYALTYVPLTPTHTRLAEYVERLMQRPSVARTIDQARPYFKYYPGRAGLSQRYFDPAIE